MKNISVRQARPDEIDWINSKYDEVNFIHSNYLNDYIIIAYLENQKVGLGRLVQLDEKNIELGGIYVFPNYRRLGVAEKIVRSLCEDNPFSEMSMWCLPFEHLVDFYGKFGFSAKNIPGEIPEKMKKKIDWVNSESKYEEKAVLLFQNE